MYAPILLVAQQLALLSGGKILPIILKHQLLESQFKSLKNVEYATDQGNALIVMAPEYLLLVILIVVEHVEVVEDVEPVQAAVIQEL